MRHIFLTLFITILCFYAKAQQRQVVDFYSLEQLQKRVLQENDTLYVVNFWATWCPPCVKELPFFKDLSKQYAERPIKFILISLDTKDNLERTEVFLQKKKIAIETHILSAGDPNIWINALEPSWQGSIPATFLFQKGSKVSFKETSFSHKKDLESFIQNRR